MTKESLVRVHKYVEARSEMEATIRIFTVVLEVIDRIAKKTQRELRIQLQPSLPIFTDILIKITDSEVPLLIIEAKKTSIATNLSPFQDATAQVLREAHIVLQKFPIKEIPFILTNSNIWGVGIAEKGEGQFIRMKLNTTHHLAWPVDSVILSSLVGHIEALICKSF